MNALAVIGKPQERAVVAPQRIEELVERFTASQDVRPSSRALYERTLWLYLSWVNRKGYPYLK